MKGLVLIIPAAGSASRFGGKIPKQFEKILGKTLCEHSVRAFIDQPIERCIIATQPQYQDEVKVLNESVPFHCEWVAGGKTRSESVRNALDRVTVDSRVLIHDAARPNVSADVIQRVITALADNDVVIPGIQVVDTIKEVHAGNVVKTLNRASLVAVQTPQGFRTSVLKSCFETAASLDYTDEAGLCEAAGIMGKVVEGDLANIKVTYLQDLERCRQQLASVCENN